jgi:hypothetical protein
MPDVDVSLRGAASIARRLQDPLAELVKIDPKSIGVGQYQHDVNQSQLARTLEAVVEDCVNAVGVDLNTASVPLLTRVSGLSTTMAKAVGVPVPSHKMAIGKMAIGAMGLKLSMIGSRFSRMARLEPMSKPKMMPNTDAMAKPIRTRPIL